MKILRSTLIVSLLLVMLVSLSGCIIIPLYKYYNDIDEGKVSSVDIYDLRSSNMYYSGFHKTELPVYTIEKDQMTEFLSDLSDIRFSDTIIITIAAIDPSFAYDDWVIRINYTDGSYSFISCDGYGETFDSDDQRIDSNHFGCDQKEWREFISRYLPPELFEEQPQD